jgi:hypothetical protein
MHTKVTIRLDRELLRRAQAYARRAHKSISTIVAEYFASLDGDKAGKETRLPPKVRSLRGALRDRGVSEDDYGTHVAEKHR